MKLDYSKSKTTRLERPSFCPFCFKLLDAASILGSEAAPTPGDFTVCIECANVLRYADDMSLIASSLMEVPTYLRMETAKIARLVKEFKKTRV